MKRIAVLLATLATAGCAGGYGLGDGGGGYPAYSASPVYYGGGGYAAPPVYPAYGGPPPGYYEGPGYAYGRRGPGDGDDGRYSHEGRPDSGRGQQNLAAQQQLYNQHVAAAQQRYNQQVSANPAAAPAARNQLTREAGEARHQLEQNTRDLRP